MRRGTVRGARSAAHLFPARLGRKTVPQTVCAFGAGLRVLRGRPSWVEDSTTGTDRVPGEPESPVPRNFPRHGPTPMTYPSHRPVSAREAIDADREAVEAFGIPSLVLMEHAGRGLAALAASYPEALEGVTVVAGPGGNGGEGDGCGRFLGGIVLPV